MLKSQGGRSCRHNNSGSTTALGQVWRSPCQPDVQNVEFEAPRTALTFDRLYLLRKNGGPGAAASRENFNLNRCGGARTLPQTKGY